MGVGTQKILVDVVYGHKLLMDKGLLLASNPIKHLHMYHKETKRLQQTPANISVFIIINVYHV